MELTEIILEALSTLTVNKLRTGLATLGIVIGIGSVIALISLGQASQQSIQNQIQSLGSNLLTVTPNFQQAGAVRSGNSVTSLTLEDAKAIAASTRISTIKSVSPEYQSRAQITAGRNNTNTQLIGVTATYSLVHKVTLSKGNFISDNEVNSLSRVIVLGPQTSADLFGKGVNPVGEQVRVHGVAMKVIGVITAKGGSGFLNQDDRAFIPLTTAQKIVFGSTNISSISVEAKSAQVMTTAQDQIGYFLLARHKLTDPTKADFLVLSQEDILNTASLVTGTFTALLSGIAAISLIVGGIGIMNIMLVTVTERTREIGLRKALGAKKKTVITQFLVESIILTIMGGIIGMILGIVTSFAISTLIKLPFTISLQAIGLASGVSGAIGILFGWYPARKAANLQPIEALRYE